MKQPPIGIMPRWFHTETRILEIIEAKERYAEAGKAVPEEWLSELIELNIWLEKYRLSTRKKRLNT